MNDAARSGLVALRKYVVPLNNRNRSGGEYFPMIEGTFFYVESCDMPLRIAFTTPDETQSLTVSSGFQLNTPFKGITLFHPAYGGSNQQINITFYVSYKFAAFTQYVNPAIQIPVPYTFLGTIGGTGRIEVPVLPGIRFLSYTGTMGITVTGGDPSTARLDNYYLDANGASINAPSIDYAGTSYTFLDVRQSEYMKGINITSLNSQYNVKRAFSPVPNGAVKMRIDLTPVIPGVVGVVVDAQTLTCFES